ncbi:MAG: response regulator transcription factor [Akkermansiaceae bacterium]|nr:response regulator transcription factor [Akkermansiaceae bacterium]
MRFDSTPHEPEKSLRVLVVEDQAMFRGFLESWVRDLPGFQFAGSFRSGEEALSCVGELCPDIALVDLQLPRMDGLALAAAFRQVRPQLRTLLLTSLTDPLTLTRVRESGVDGYLEKDAPTEELGTALRTIAAGRPYFSRSFDATLSAEGKLSEAVGKILSRREQQILSLILAGRTSREIAASLSLSPRTVEFHRANLMAKLGATSLSELHHRARQRGFV